MGTIMSKLHHPEYPALEKSCQKGMIKSSPQHKHVQRTERVHLEVIVHHGEDPDLRVLLNL